MSHSPARVGIIGGGQLGRMLAMAAQRLDLRPVILDPQENAPAGPLSSHCILGDYHDPERLAELARIATVSTFEIENIDPEPLLALEAQGHVLHPSPRLLAVLQDKLTQKQTFKQHGIPTADFIACDDPNVPDAAEIFAQFGYPLVQKARRGGYDGRGVAVLRNAADFPKRLNVPSVLERYVERQKELAVMAARGQDGHIQCYPVVEMTFQETNTLDTLLAPARISEDIADTARDLARRTVETLDGVGVFGVELFLTHEGQLLVNEVAPRTHNSGHYTIEACYTDQFEQHLRAITGLPLGSTEQMRPAVMFNLLGEPGFQGAPKVEGLEAALAIPGVCVHLYGKTTTRPYRKMGHVTVLGDDLGTAQVKAARVREMIRVRGSETDGAVEK